MLRHSDVKLEAEERPRKAYTCIAKGPCGGEMMWPVDLGNLNGTRSQTRAVWQHLFEIDESLILVILLNIASWNLIITSIETGTLPSASAGFGSLALLFFDSTILLLCDIVRIWEVSQGKVLWQGTHTRVYIYYYTFIFTFLHRMMGSLRAAEDRCACNFATQWHGCHSVTVVIVRRLPRRST